MLSKKDLIEWFQEHTPGARGGDLCSYIVEGDKGAKYHALDVCHARALIRTVKYHAADIGKPIAVHDGIYYNPLGDKKKHERYWEFLLCPKISPFRKYLKNTEVYRKNDGSFIGYSIRDMNVPSLVVENFLIAMRQPFERPKRLNSFAEYVDFGLDPVEAFYLSNTCDLNKDVVSPPHGEEGHLAVNFYGEYDYASMRHQPQTFNFEGAKSGDLTISAKDKNSFYEDYGLCSNSNSIWKGPKGKLKNPLNLGFKAETVYVYNGVFRYAVDKFPDFPYAKANRNGGGARYTEKPAKISDLLKEKAQWSPLK